MQANPEFQIYRSIVEGDPYPRKVTLQSLQQKIPDYVQKYGTVASQIVLMVI